MPTIHPRINVVMEPPLFKVVARLASREGISLSLKVRDLVKEALEFHEDLNLSKLARAREKTFSRSKALTHEQMWGPLKREKRS